MKPHGPLRVGEELTYSAWHPPSRSRPCLQAKLVSSTAAGDETVGGAFPYQREQLGKYGVLERGPGTRGRWCQGVQPPDARRSKRELVGGLLETMLHGADKQFADFL